MALPEHNPSMGITDLEGYCSVRKDLYCGLAWQREITALQEDVHCSVVEIIFEPMAFTQWHSHSGYQVILVTGGEGYYQEKGLEKQKVNVGDVIKIKSGTVHRHYASDIRILEHTAITFNNSSGAATIWNNIDTSS